MQWSWLDTRHYLPDFQISSHMCIAAGLRYPIWPWSRFYICQFLAIFPLRASTLSFPLLCTSLFCLHKPFTSFAIFLCFYRTHNTFSLVAHANFLLMPLSRANTRFSYHSVTERDTAKQPILRLKRVKNLEWTTSESPSSAWMMNNP